MPHVSRIRVNNYHPEELYLSNSKVPMGYLLFSYQTKAFDECTNSLRILLRMSGSSWSVIFGYGKCRISLSLTISFVY
jgi:hypothetical protein